MNRWGQTKVGLGPGVAQWIERQVRNWVVVGSNPTARTQPNLQARKKGKVRASIKRFLPRRVVAFRVIAKYIRFARLVRQIGFCPTRWVLFGLVV